MAPDLATTDDFWRPGAPGESAERISPGTKSASVAGGRFLLKLVGPEPEDDVIAAVFDDLIEELPESQREAAVKGALSVLDRRRRREK